MIDTLQDLEALRAQARRTETPCGGAALVWHVWGESQRPPLLLLHGGSGSWTHWLRNIDPLVAAGWQVLVPDMPGFGDSAVPPDGRDADVLPAWLEAGLQRLIGNTPLPVVGFSFGALVAGLWTQRAPARIKHLVLVGSPCLSADRLQPLDLRRWDTTPAGPARDALHRHNLLQLMLADPAAATRLAVAVHAANVERDRLRQRRLMLTDALVPLLPTLRCPVAGLWGCEDALYRHRLPLIGWVLATAPRFESLRLLPGAGHWVAFEAADAFNAGLLAQLGGPAA